MSGSMSGMWKRSYGELLGHRQTKGAATDKPDLQPPRHILDSTDVLGFKAIEARPPLTFRPKWCWE